ncbi:cysteine desulfurase family protein [Tundrisphaera lichenicola]|uniref:cysteine desulfurase family protein n=1 Tax=Tundrisphaera lichenicola TaxID=2029860 RepID=UPI003EBB287F
MSSIYLDHNATTPIDPEVLEAMRPHWLAGGNPESRHAAGRSARRALHQAREQVAEILGARTGEVVFTSGGTEANNLAIFGLAAIDTSSDPHLISSPIEHPAVAGAVAKLEADGFAADRPDVDDEGRADPAVMASMIRPGTRLATLMLASNETGAIQPVVELAGMARERGVPTHTDAVQAVGRIPVDFHALGVDTLAASAHKFHGPAGVGLLLVREGIKLPPRLFGGNQQGGIRPGTPAVALAVGLATALVRWHEAAAERVARWERLRDRLESGLIDRLGPGRVVRNGPLDDASRLPQTINLGFPGLDGDALLMQLDLAGVAASLGSACASGASEPSPTLLAMSVPADRLRSSVRFSLGASTTEAEIQEAVRRIAAVVERIATAEGPDFSE